MINKYLKVLLNGGAPEPEPRDARAEALALAEAGDAEQALPLLHAALEAAPQDGPVLLALLKLHLDRGEWQLAYEHGERARRLRPKDPQLAYQLGEALYGLERYDEAEAQFRRASTQDPDFTDAHIRLGMLLAEKGQLADAVKSFERAIFLDRTAVVARFHLAHVCLRLGDEKRALTQLHLVKELQPEYAPVFLLQGEIQQRLGDHRQAVVEFDRAIELGAGDGGVYWQLAHSHAQLGDRENQLKCLTQVLRLDPSNWPAAYQAAKLHEAQNRLSQALELYQPLVGVLEFAEEAREAVERITRTLDDISSAMGGGEPEAESADA